MVVLKIIEVGGLKMVAIKFFVTALLIPYF